MNKRKSTRNICAVLCISVFLSACFTNQLTVYGAGKVLTLSQAQNLALSKNKAYQKVKSKIAMQQVKYTEAVKSIQLKKKNMATFRWSPLLSFKFPQKADLADAYQFQYKPLQIQTQITALTHQLQDTRYEVLEKISVQYVQTYIYQEKIAFAKEQIDSLEKAIAKNEARVKTGEARQADVDKMKTSLKKLENDMSLYLRSIEGAKRKISDLTGMDITTGYQLTDPLVTADIDRDKLKGLISYTLEEDQSYYEAKLTTQLAYTSLTLNESLMKSQYGSKMNILNPYLSQAVSQEEVDGDAFKSAYDQFLVNIDAPWSGKLRILFIRIPKEWFKGSIDGVRYVEDEPYALYTAVLDYQDAVLEQKSMEKELTGNVTDSFEALITARNAYQSLQDTSLAEKAEVEKSTVLNQIGELPYDELSSQQTGYEETQMECLDALASYSELLYSFDRLTCGGITAYLEGEGTNQEAAAGGTSYLEEELAEGAYYYIQSKVEDNVFLFGIHVPEEFNIDITDYELWIDEVQIGARTSADGQLRHLALALDNPQRVSVRLYNGDELVDEVEIDPQVNQAELKIQGGYRVVNEDTQKKAAVFSYQVDSGLNMAEIGFQPETGEPIAYYQVTDAQGNPLFSQKLIPIAEKFRYLSVMVGDISQLRVMFYDSNQQKLYEGILDELTKSVIAAKE